MERAAFLARIRGRLTGERLDDVAVPSDWAVQVEDLAQRFSAELEAIGGHAWRAPPREAAAILGEIVASGDHRTIVATREDGVPSGIEAVVRASGGRLRWWPDAARDGIADAGCGVTSALCGVAETGTVVVGSAPPSGRAPSLLPPVFVCFLPLARLLPTVKDAFDRMPDLSRDSSNVVLVTGPSKSADIGLELTQGVHGPGEVHVVLVEDAEESPA